jgi:thiaminase/transcriptional activator TenA
VTFSAELRDLTATTWDAAVGHRFVDELWGGVADPATLSTYFVQDHQFLDAFVALMGATVAAADRPEPRIVHARQLGLIAGPENDFFDRTLDALDVGTADRESPELREPTRGFLALMDAARTGADYAGCLTVLLVAEWLYLDWATRPDAAIPEHPISQEWIALHSGPAFARWVDFLRTEFDRVTAGLDDAGRATVREVFVRAVELELQFFDAAYG